MLQTAARNQDISASDGRLQRVQQASQMMQQACLQSIAGTDIMGQGMLGRVLAQAAMRLCSQAANQVATQAANQTGQLPGTMQTPDMNAVITQTAGQIGSEVLNQAINRIGPGTAMPNTSIGPGGSAPANPVTNASSAIWDRLRSMF